MPPAAGGPLSRHRHGCIIPASDRSVRRDTPAMMNELSGSSEIATDRRSNLVLRALIDEMLERVRELNRKAEAWSGTDRARAEAELDSIMARVRRVAAQQASTE